MEGVGQVQGQWGGRGDGAGVHHPSGGRRHCLAQLPQEDFWAGQQQSREPNQQHLQQNGAAALHPPGLLLGRGGGRVETVDPQGAQREGGYTERRYLQAQEERCCCWDYIKTGKEFPVGFRGYRIQTVEH